MNIEDIKAKLTVIFRATFFDDAIVLRDDMVAGDVPGWDSLSHINLVLAVEKGFKIRLTTREVRGMKNVGDMVRLVQQKIA